MIKYGVWFAGDKYSCETLCYCGRDVYIANTLEQAIEYKEDLKNTYYYDNSEDKFKIVRIELEKEE